MHAKGRNGIKRARYPGNPRSADHDARNAYTKGLA